jgi:2-polyprenyl-6-hydroxyphenyl methylase/3-demethylubiquinone-9 3-methyltransferase
MGSQKKSAPWFGRARNKVRYYRGLRQKTDLYVHDRIVEEIRSCGFDLKKGGTRVLDLGCGEGALAQLLHDEGADVVAVDVDEKSFKAVGPLFKKVDFDESESVDNFIEETAGEFHVIVASEVIEHVRNPWELFATIKRLSTPNTKIIITSPNVSSWWGRFWFFISGELWGFGKHGWNDPGHINPITEERFEGIAEDMGFYIESRVSTGVLPIIWAYNWKRLAISLLCLPFRLVQKGALDGWVRLYRIKRLQ